MTFYGSGFKQGRFFHKSKTETSFTIRPGEAKEVFVASMAEQGSANQIMIASGFEGVGRVDASSAYSISFDLYGGPMPLRARYRMWVNANGKLMLQVA